MLDQGPFAHPDIALAQLDPELFRQPDETLAGAMHQLGIGGKGYGLGLHRRIDDGLGKIGGLGRSAPRGCRKTFLKQHIEFVLAS
jgi:hypothetical protein